jgi:dipeptidyl aminopeptidase/acylaminoacyl peptidase
MAVGRWICAAAVLLLGAGCAGPGVDSAGPAEPLVERREGSLLLAGVPEISQSTLSRVAQYYETRSARLQGFLGDEVLITTRFADTLQLHRVRRPLAAREQLTFFDEPVIRAYVPPGNASGFVYARDTAGAEFYQLYWYDRATGSHRLLTDGAARHGGVVFARDGSRFAYYSTSRNGRVHDVHVQDMDGNVTIALAPADGAWYPLDFSPDGTRLLVLHYVSINEAYLFEVEIGSGAQRALLPHGVRAGIGDARYDTAGAGVFFTSDLGAEFVRLHRLDLSSGQLEVLTADVPWDVEAFELAPDGSLLALSINEGGVSRIVLRRLPEQLPVALPELPRGVVDGLAFSADSGTLAFSVSTSVSPSDVWSVGIGQRRLTRWTRSEVGGLDADGFVTPRLLDYPTFDLRDGERRRIPVFLYLPEGSGPHPVLVLIHGGPETQYRPWFSAFVQYVVGELGMAVIAPNVRGSSGYGKTYLTLDNGRRREDSVRDIGALLDWVATRAELDTDRVAVMGASYGGYMVLAALAHYPERLAAGVEAVGITSFVTFLGNTQPYRQDLRRAEYGDERDPEMREFLTSISPLSNVEALVRPLKIAQGANDPRVPASESEQIRAALAAQGTPVWYVLAEDEGHGFRRKANQVYDAAVTSRFLEEFVLR